MISGVPRISSSLDRNLYTCQSVSDQGPFNELIASPVRAKYIIEHWEEMQRVASLFRHESVSASLLMCQLCAYWSFPFVPVDVTGTKRKLAFG
ncbi:Tn3 family transposase [Dictyobacter alpinus]|uniref:Tn3 family transposase n=1 Tax=Dictyobacter alpinus TaxID=2014873 RepID=UPI000F828E02